MKKFLFVLLFSVLLASCTITINSDEVSMKSNNEVEKNDGNNVDTQINQNNVIGIKNIDGSLKPSIENNDSKRLKNINDLIKKVNIEVSKGTAINNMVIVNKTYKATINGNIETVNQGIINFDTLREIKSNFQDNINGKIIDYPIAYSVGGTGTGAFKFMQISTVNIEKNQARVVGNYYKMKSTDSAGLLLDNNGNFLVDGGNNLPYSIK